MFSVPAPVLSTGVTSGNKKNKHLCPHRPYVLPLEEKQKNGKLYIMIEIKWYGGNRAWNRGIRSACKRLSNFTKEPGKASLSENIEQILEEDEGVLIGLSEGTVILANGTANAKNLRQGMLDFFSEQQEVSVEGKKRWRWGQTCLRMPNQARLCRDL